MAKKAVSKPSPSKTASLYGDEVHIDFDSRKHAYRVNDLGDEFYAPSVTTILGIIAKPALTQWAANCAVEDLDPKMMLFVKEAVGKGSFDEVEYRSILDSAKTAFRRTSKAALDVGSLAHEWIENYLWGRMGINTENPYPGNEQAKKACLAAVSWIESHAFKPHKPESIIYSRKHKYVGTMDFPGEVDGKLSVVDWKSSKAIFSEYKLQLAAYAVAYSEMTGEDVQDRWLVRLGKDDGEFEDRLYPASELQYDFEAFLAFRKGYLWQKAQDSQ